MCHALHLTLSLLKKKAKNVPVFMKNIKVKEESWKVIEPRAFKMGLDRLVRKVKEDLFAREANFHKTCFKDFHLKYLNYLKAEQKKEERHSEAQSDPATAHDYSFSVILNIVKKSNSRKTPYHTFRIAACLRL